jgi:hypothetical protein
VLASNILVRTKDMECTSPSSYFILFFYFLFIYSHVHTLFGPFLAPPLHVLSVPLTPPHFQGEPILLLSLILLKRRHKQ